MARVFPNPWPIFGSSDGGGRVTWKTGDFLILERDGDGSGSLLGKVIGFDAGCPVVRVLAWCSGHDGLKHTWHREGRRLYQEWAPEPFTDGSDRLRRATPQEVESILAQLCA